MENPELTPDSTLHGRYRIIGLIGRGGMGCVYRAQDLELAREVALKVLLLPPAARPDLAARFGREARAMALLAHDNIVRIFDRFVADGLPFVVMELLHGQTLEALLARGALDIPLAVRIGAQIADALDTAHAHGVVHRDVKPSNVYIEGGGGRERVKLLDFGLAKLAMDVHSLTGPDEVFGTLRYMPPEQVKSSKEAGAPADLYALGAVLHEMLTGVPPFDGDSRLALYFKVINDPTPALRTRRPDAPYALAELVDGCLNKLPMHRPRAGHALAALRGLLQALQPPPSVRVLPAPTRIDGVTGFTAAPSATTAPAFAEPPST
jgi:eukaryotic-like serine/threonine-protein kinase